MGGYHCSEVPLRQMEFPATTTEVPAAAAAVVIIRMVVSNSLKLYELL